MVGIAESDGEQVYLVDHAWTYRTEQARLQLTDIPGLAARLANLMDLDMVGTLLHIYVYIYPGTYIIFNSKAISILKK
jgi:hypothetical protein